MIYWKCVEDEDDLVWWVGMFNGEKRYIIELYYGNISNSFKLLDCIENNILKVINENDDLITHITYTHICDILKEYVIFHERKIKISKLIKND
jgi:hypothetical protein